MTQREDKLDERLDHIVDVLANMRTELAAYMAGRQECKNKCDVTHKAVFGNGNSVGIRAKLWVMWGLFCLIGTGMVAGFFKLATAIAATAVMGKDVVSP